MKPRTVFWGIIAYGIVGVLGLASTALARKPTSMCPNGIAEPGEGCDGSDFRGQSCETFGFTGGTLVCTATCQVDESGCFCAFPGDGAGHGPTLKYTDNGDGTATDNNTLLMWEVKNSVAGSVHNVDNTYAWSSGGTAEDGPLFTVFLATLNNTCDGDETTACTSNADCATIGNGLCGHAGHRDWRIPNVKELQSIVDYGTFNPAIAPSFPGSTAASGYWSSTSFASNPVGVWVVFFNAGVVNFAGKNNLFHGRAVRGGS